MCCPGQKSFAYEASNNPPAALPDISDNKVILALHPLSKTGLHTGGLPILVLSSGDSINTEPEIQEKIQRTAIKVRWNLPATVMLMCNHAPYYLLIKW